MRHRWYYETGMWRNLFHFTITEYRNHGMAQNLDHTLINMSTTNHRNIKCIPLTDMEQLHHFFSSVIVPNYETSNGIMGRLHLRYKKV